jgi:asparagine synthase (glutamine-hydrolysing)
MCGIVGFINRSNLGSNIISNMLKTIKHRGPDDNGMYIDEYINLGHARLSIIDLSVAGHQPMISKCQRYILVYNGEVYNFKEIKNDLEKKYKFISHSDTEVILYAIVEYGIEEALHKFNGMFSFSFYDSKTQELYLARDRMGVKPLYYYKTEDEFIFSSELKAMYKHPSFKRNISTEALTQYLQYGYVPSPLSIYENCYKLEPASYIKVDIKNLEIKKTKYWLPKKNSEIDSISTYDDYVDKTLEILQSSVKYRMIADVPVASFLSGGIDSSLVTALMKEENSSTQTFTIGFHEEKYNEAKKAKRVAEHLGTNHHEYYCSLDEVKNIIPELPHIYDEPYADSSAIPTILLSRFTSESAKVAMSADGGDELFGGYNKYIQYNKAQKFLKTPFMLRQIALYGLKPFSSKIGRFDKIESLLNAKNQEDIFQTASTAFQEYNIAKLLKQTSINCKDIEFDSLDFRNNFMLYDMKYLLEGDILTKVDRATMSASLESREPLLDHRLVELSTIIPSEMKFKYGQKSILKDIAKQYIPKEIIDMPKQGFNVPMNEWLKDDLKSLLDHYISYENIEKTDLFHTQEIIALKERFLKGKEHVYKIWYILSFMMWHEKERV